ncbi:glycerophosphodiester phosphodiesterase [Enterococcus sp. DIV0876]|uniref:glycerophosphodiester phosphodiesterase n=1 Tax=Enterococcus sp. DIV0876 TaxID=2774633 RepID=UPI003D2FABE5
MVQIVAHRGSSGNRPENTLPAFAEAVRVKADIIELDVHLSKDEQLIVMHDETVDRTTNGKGRICDLTVAQLKELNAGSWFSDEFKAAKIPTLKEVLDLLAAKNYRGILTIELKTDHYDYPGIEAKTAALLNSQAWPFTHWYCSFNMASLDRIHDIDPEAKLNFIMGKAADKPALALDRAYIEGLHPAYGWIEANAEKVAAYPISLRPWTINEEATIRRCLQLGVTGIITDFPERARGIVQAFREEQNQ